MYLIGDIGNTETKICFINSKYKIQSRKIFKTNLITVRYLSVNFKNLIKNKNRIKKVIFSSVVPKTYKILKTFIESKTNKKCNEIKKMNLKDFVKIKVNKKQVGSDRLANAIGAIDNKSNYIIVDFGTATTFDIINKNQYLGGIISPGINLSLQTLVSKASLIPTVNLTKISNVIGKNTKTAIKSGFYWGYTGLINNIIKLILKNTKKKYKIILTGGMADLFKNSINSKSVVNKNLTINGILKILKKIK